MPLHGPTARVKHIGSITHRANHTCRADHKEGAAVVRPVGVFDPPPPSVEGEQGVLNVPKSKGQNLPTFNPSTEGSRQGLGSNHRRPR